MSRRSRLCLMLLLLPCLAPGPGNIGSCGQQAELLDSDKFFAAKQFIDCDRCTECALGTQACAAACGGVLVRGQFPEGCNPLVHDGEVCLDALRAASCGDYGAFVAEEGATIVTECDFCPLDDDGQPKRSEP